MKRTAFDEFRDQKTAREVDTEQHLMCAAHGCPLRWSINFGQKLCTVHADYELHDWPRVTEWIRQREADLAFQRQNKRVTPAPVLSADQRRAIGQRLRRALRQAGGRTWAERLKAREEQGEDLTATQRDMWRYALGVRSDAAEVAP